jgi:DNA-binding response OmpR family regulator
MTKILIIDDDQDILRLLEFALKRVGYQVVIATDGAQGLAQLDSQKPDLIVADIMMPKMTGYEFCRQVRARPDSMDTPIIMFSARFQPIDRQTALEAGATDYLPKSTSPDTLLNRIKEILPDAGPAVAAKTIGFFSLRGGSGVTSLAVNSAIALARGQKAKLALVDLAPLGGHSAVMIGLRPTSSLVTALNAAPELSLEELTPHLIEHNAGVHLLASELHSDSRWPANSKLEQLATVLRSGFGVTIFDVPRAMLEQSYHTMWQQLDKIALVLSPDLPSLQSTAIALQRLAQFGVSKGKIELVVNQVFPSSALPLDAIQNAVRRPIAANIPFEPDMIKAVNSGKPLLLSSPKCAGAAAIARLANLLLN